jgi:AcrR family transcriptional regulator
MSITNLLFGMLLLAVHDGLMNSPMLIDAPEQIVPTAGQTRKQTGKRLRDAEATREQVLLAAIQEFADKGLHGARVEEIAARTSTSKHMIYYYFGSKDGLYSAVLEHAYAGFRTAENAVDYDTLDPVAALTTLVESTFDAHLHNPDTIRILMSENLDRARHAKEIDHSSQRQLVLGTTQRILKRGVDAGLFRDDVDALQFHLMISAFSFFVVANRYTFGTVFEIDLTERAVIAAQRNEFVETMLCRCRK